MSARPVPERTATATMRANQPGRWFTFMAFLLLCAVRRIGLAQTQTAAAIRSTIGRKLPELGARVPVITWRIKVAIASACPWQNEFALAYAGLRGATARDEADIAWSTALPPTLPIRQRRSRVAETAAASHLLLCATQIGTNYAGLPQGYS